MRYAPHRLCLWIGLIACPTQLLPTQHKSEGLLRMSPPRRPLAHSRPFPAEHRFVVTLLPALFMPRAYLLVPHTHLLER